MLFSWVKVVAVTDPTLLSKCIVLFKSSDAVTDGSTLLLQ